MGPPPVTFELKVREQNQLGFWNISIRPTSGASLIKIGRPTFSTSGTLSQTMTLKRYLIVTWDIRAERHHIQLRIISVAMNA